MNEYLELLYEALSKEIGFVVHTPYPDRLKQKLYQARAKSGDALLNNLSFRTSPQSPTDEIWIIKNAS